MTVYIILMILALSGYFVGANRTEQSRKYYLFVVFSAILLVAILRSDQVGTDLRIYYSKYYPLYKNVPWDKIQSVTVSGDWEWGFCAFCKLIGQLSTDVQCFIVFSSIVSVVPYALFIYRNSDDVVFSSVFFLGYHIYMQSLNVIRQAMAVGIILLGVEALKRKKYIVFLVYVFIATMFHTSAIIAVLLLVCDLLKYNRNTIYKLTAITLVFTIAYRVVFERILSGSSALSNLYGIYSSSGSGDSGGYVTYHTLGMFGIALVVFMIGCLYYYNEGDQVRLYEYGKRWRSVWHLQGLTLVRNYHDADEQIYWSDSMLIYAVYFAVLFRFSAFLINVTARFAMYFIPFLMIASPYFCNKICDNKTRKIVKFGMIAIVLAFFFFIGYTRAGELWGTVPYEFCF